MTNLLSASFHRVRLSRFFWILEGAAAAMGAGICLLCRLNRSSLGPLWVLQMSTSCCFMPVLVLPLFASLFCGLFLGQDMETGAIRNRLIPGHSRTVLYLSDLLVCPAASLLFLATPLLLFPVLGPILAGPEMIQGLDQPLYRALCAVPICLALSAIFVLLNRLGTASSRSRSPVVSLLLALALSIAGFLLTSTLNEPEFQDQMTMAADGTFHLEEHIPNSRYLRGPIRSVFQALHLLLPTSQTMDLCQRQSVLSPAMPLCSLLVFAALSLAGSRLFHHRDLN